MHCLMDRPMPQHATGFVSLTTGFFMQAGLRLGLLLGIVLCVLPGCDTFSDDEDEWVTRTIDRTLDGEGVPAGECQGVYAGWAQIELSGTGEGPPFGSSTLTATACFNLATGTFAPGTGTVVAENGDEAYWTFNIELNLQTGAFTDAGEFTGGTGRYENIHGTFTGAGTMDIQFDESGQPVFPIPVTEDIAGVVTYRN